jgi:hypothetical protein
MRRPVLPVVVLGMGAALIGCGRGHEGSIKVVGGKTHPLSWQGKTVSVKPAKEPDKTAVQVRAPNNDLYEGYLADNTDCSDLRNGTAVEIQDNTGKTVTTGKVFSCGR